MATPVGSADCGDQPGGSPSSALSCSSPQRGMISARSPRAVSEALGRSQNLVGRLTVDVLNPGNGEDKVGTFLQRHGVVIPILIHKAASCRIRQEIVNVSPPTVVHSSTPANVRTY
jgi:hypothetical protein